MAAQEKSIKQYPFARQDLIYFLEMSIQQKKSLSFENKFK
jgi:hypothetical protein